jgi:RHS repeat-associated protein
VTITGGGSGATATAAFTGTTVAGITLTGYGANYTSVPAATFSGGGGTGAAATVTVLISKTIGWDVENRPVTVTSASSASFVYDGDSNRVKKTENGQTILYINQYYEKNLTTGVVTTSYYLGGQLVATREGTTLRYIHTDSLGSTSVMTTSTGTVDSSIAYFPFGSTRTGTVNTTKEFTGQRLDSTGLYYYNARYYKVVSPPDRDPQIGRFISPDTEGIDLTNPQTLNRYSYCLNNPLNRTDPTGHKNVDLDGGGGKVKPSPPDDKDLTVVWGYYDEIEAIGVYYHSCAVVTNSKGDYFKIETWGGGITIDGGYRSGIAPPGPCESGGNSWTLDIAVHVDFIAWEAGAELTLNTQKGVSGSGGENKNGYLAFCTPGPVLTVSRSVVIQIQPQNIYQNVPRWVPDAYRYTGYKFPK